MGTPRPSDARLRQIMARQWEDKWGPAYVPATLNSYTEAPSGSETASVTAAKLGRAVNTQSKSETWLTVFALFNPNLWDLHQQRILYPTPRPHFLTGHPRARAIQFPAFRGTLDVAERMGMLERHPACKITVIQHGVRTRIMAAFPYTGDLLLYLQDAKSAYAVNWNVKDKKESFHASRPRRGKPRILDYQPMRDRNSLERIYYSDAGIPTHEIAGSQLDYELRCNLMDLFLVHSRPLAIPAEVRKEMVNAFRDAVGARFPANKLCNELARKHGLAATDVECALSQSIWNRDLRIDLFRRYLVDRPLRPEIHDPLAVYADWFGRA